MRNSSACFATCTMSSSVRVYVQWKEPTVFSGEELECKITFKNVAPPPEPSPSLVYPSEFASEGSRQRKTPPLQATIRNPRGTGLPNLTQSRERGHRPAASLNVPLNAKKMAVGAFWTAPQNDSVIGGHKHHRSVSIISLGEGETVERDGEGKGGPGQLSAARRPGRKHARSASLQILPRWPLGVTAGPSSGG